MTDAKEWVTIKIPESIRDDASDDPRTYGEVMQDGLNADVDNGDTVNMDPTPAGVPSAGEIAAEIDGSVDERTLAEYVADYLVTEYELPRKVAEEVRP